MADGIDPFLMSYHGGRLARYKERIFGKYDESNKEERKEATREFTYKARFWQANVQYHDLEVVMHEDIMERTIKEYDLVDEMPAPGTMKGYEDLFSEYVNRINQEVYDNGLSFVFFGVNETGKTITAVHMLCSAIERGLSGYCIPFKDLLNLYNNAEFGREPEASKMWQYIKDCDFLVIDEIGKESKVTENVLGVFEQIVKHRTEEVKPTIMATNINFPHKRVQQDDGSSKREGGFFGRYGNSVYNSLITNYRIIGFSKGGQFRKRTRRKWFDES
jgi:DNA replication protein DnaC